MIVLEAGTDTKITTMAAKRQADSIQITFTFTRVQSK
jgi:hypothetical protein